MEADPFDEPRSGLRARGEEAVGELAQALLENPLFNSALATALGAGERAASAQRSAMGALHVASVSDVERLEQRLRSLSGRLEAIEDRLDEVADQVARMNARLDDDAGPVSTDQSKLDVAENEAPQQRRGSATPRSA
jgi:CRP-like cAMP-binding protein